MTKKFWGRRRLRWEATKIYWRRSNGEGGAPCASVCRSVSDQMLILFTQFYINALQRSESVGRKVAASPWCVKVCALHLRRHRPGASASRSAHCILGQSSKTHTMTLHCEQHDETKRNDESRRRNKTKV